MGSELSSKNKTDQEWSVSFGGTAFPDYDGIRVHNIPSGTTGYGQSESVFTAKVGIECLFHKDWTVGAGLQVGPRSDLAFTNDGTPTPPLAQFESDFLSFTVGRKFDLGKRSSVAPKIGLEQSKLSSKLVLDDSSDSLEDTSTDSLATLELQMSLSRGFHW